jgi:hypothetical protein
MGGYETAPPVSSMGVRCVPQDRSSETNISRQCTCRHTLPTTALVPSTPPQSGVSNGHPPESQSEEAEDDDAEMRPIPMVNVDKLESDEDDLSSYLEVSQVASTPSPDEGFIRVIHRPRFPAQQPVHPLISDNHDK